MHRLSDYPVSMLEADTAVIFCLDSELRITYCNSAWNRFPLENGGEGLTAPTLLGRCILDFTEGAVRSYYSRQYQRVLIESEPWEHDYECSSAEVYRLFHLRVVPMRKAGGLLAINALRVQRPHQIAASALLEEVYRHGHGLIVMCANCRRTKRNAHDKEVWDWVPNFVRTVRSDVTHGICLPCREYYYPDVPFDD